LNISAHPRIINAKEKTNENMGRIGSIIQQQH
jgi:hypothetical protein